MSRKTLFTRSSGISRPQRLLCAAVLSLAPLTAGCTPHQAPANADQERMTSAGIVCGLAVGNGPRITCSVRPSFSRGAKASPALAPELTSEDPPHHALSRCYE